MTVQEKAKAIRERLKKIGCTSRQVSVKSGYCGYSDYVNVTIKDLTVNKEAVENICYAFGAVDYDEYTGEILEGGNTYVTVAYA